MTSLPVINCLEPKCGACCMEQAGLPVSWYLSFVKFGDPSTLPENVLQELKDYLAKVKRDGWPDDPVCIWLNRQTLQCMHYEYRPDVCRDEEDGVVPGNKSCLGWREKYGIA
jgi:Fe-S-cluster containining protein